MIKSSWNVMYLLIIEIIFGALLILPFFSLQEKQIPLVAYFLTMICSCLVFSLLLQRYKEMGKVLFFVLILPAVLIGGNVMDFPIFLNLLISFLIFWRTLSHFHEPDKQNIALWLLFTILLGIVLLFFAGVSSSEYMTIIGGLMIAQLLFIISGGFIRKWLDLSEAGKNKKQFFRPFIVIFSAISLLCLLITIGMSTIRWLFFSIISGGVSLVAFIAKPFFNWAESRDWSEQFNKLNKNQGPEEFSAAQNELDPLEKNIIFDPTIIVTILFIACLLFLFYYLYKNKRKVNEAEKISSETAYTVEKRMNNGSTSFFQRGKALSPSHPIRKEIFAFERYAEKLQLGRWPFESLSDWLTRIGMYDFNEINRIYEKVRYGDQHYSDSEKMQLKEMLHKKKLELKEMNKQKKRRGKK
ncbi:preprotein translocase subunit SecG [Cytobacillus eiseniae]|uniref:Preprotein translocase subunit SecG n=1 Tax=Cytobacillus eiseniae TaxID=762947 RepID=A0ABS4RAL3_9BACI|nr:hypothetical protein [Cytobacillus eiseniae]MBP2239933.1 preprotein translocase subunit SecG [Cytobacillus eiseniae]